MGAFAIAAAGIRVALPLLARRLAEWQVIYASTLLAAGALLAYPWMHGPSAWARARWCWAWRWARCSPWC
jgi:hypothetical protein